MGIAAETGRCEIKPFGGSGGDVPGTPVTLKNADRTVR